MEKRLAYAEHLIASNLINAPKFVVLLTCNRKAEAKYDCTEDLLEQIAKESALPKRDELTEPYLFITAYQNSSLYKRYGRQIYMICEDATQVGHNTYDENRLSGLVNWLAEHKEVQNVSLISGQPYVQRHETLVKLICSMHNISNITLDVVGEAVSNNIDLATVSDAFGTTIYTKTPSAMLAADLHLTVAEQDLRERFTKLYEGHPVLLRSGQNLFNTDKKPWTKTEFLKEMSHFIR
jgi:hypothetical protein